MLPLIMYTSAHNPNTALPTPSSPLFEHAFLSNMETRHKQDFNEFSHEYKLSYTQI